MPPIYLANTIHSFIKFANGGRNFGMNQYWNANSSPFTAADLQTMAEELHDNFLGNLLPLLSTATHLTGVVCTDISGPLGATSEYDEDAAGANASGALGLNTAATVSLHTARRYRGGHGRNYIGGLAQDNLVDASHFSVAAADALEDAYEALRINIEGVNFGAIHVNKMQVLHGRMQVVPHTVPPTYVAAFSDDVTSVSVNTRIDSQRRRTGKT